MTDTVHENVGYYTWDQFTRLQKAVNNARKIVPWLRVAGYLRNADTDIRVKTSRDGHIGLPPTWIAAEEISRLLSELNQWTELEDAVNDEHGAWIAWEFVRETETANARWPWSDRTHRIGVMRCTSCDALTLRYHPPRHHEDRIIVKCSDTTCGALLDEDMFTRAAALIESEHHEREKRLADRRRSRGNRRKIQANDLPVGA